jgi:hypothetical protein
MAHATIHALAVYALLVVAAGVEARPAVGLVGIGIDALIAANDESWHAITGATQAQATGLARAAGVAALAAIAGAEVQIDALTVAVGVTKIAVASTVDAIGMGVALVVTLSAVVIILRQVDAYTPAH